MNFILLRIRRKFLAALEWLLYAMRRSSGQHTFFIVSCQRNAGQHAIDCLTSVYRQRYDRKKIRHLFIDDASTDGTHEMVISWLAAHPDHSVDYRHNNEREGGTSNTLAGLRMAEGDAIMVELNGDDWLPDHGVLQFFDKVYADPNVWMTYNTLKVNDGPPAPWAQPIPAAIIATNSYRDLDGWQTSHLHTFRRQLLDHIEDNIFIDPDTGYYWECGDDQALYLSLLELAGRHARHINRITYVYNFHEASHAAQDSCKSLEVSARIRKGPRYKPLARLESNVEGPSSLCGSSN